MKKIILFLALVVLSSCAGVNIYNDESCNKGDEVGLKFYQPKPFLLVEHNPAKDVKMKASIVYLPDLANPRYVKVTQGWGTANATIGFANGVMNSYGAISDSKGPEALTALAGLTTAYGASSLALEQALDLEERRDEEFKFEAGGSAELQKLWDELAAELNDIAVDTKGISRLKESIESEKKTKNEIIDKLKEVRNDILSYKYHKKNELSKTLSDVAKKLEDTNLQDITPDMDPNAARESYVKELRNIAKKLTPKVLNKVKTWELYEIILDKNEMKIKPVVLKNIGDKK